MPFLSYLVHSLMASSLFAFFFGALTAGHIPCEQSWRQSSKTCVSVLRRGQTAFISEGLGGSAEMRLRGWTEEGWELFELNS